MYTFKDGEIAPYGQAPPRFFELADVDGDKRPDLTISGPFQAEGPCGLEGRTYHGPLQVAHSLPGGAFSIDDAVAKEVVRAQCGPAPAELVTLFKQDGADNLIDDEGSARRITCARIYGAKIEDTQRRVRKDYPFAHEADDSEPSSSAGFCLSLKELVKLAGQEPTFTIDPPCPAK
jgi:hypothetical protein